MIIITIENKDDHNRATIWRKYNDGFFRDENAEKVGEAVIEMVKKAQEYES